MRSHPRAAVVLAVLGILLQGLCALVPAPADEPKEETAKPSGEQAAKDLAPRICTLPNEISLKTALAELAKQTRNTVTDRRRGEQTNPVLKLAVHKATFWQALEAIAKAADLRISLYQRDGQIALVDGPYRALPVSFSGLFRTTVKRVTTVADLENDAHFTLVQLEVAWEPRFQPFLVETRPDGLVIEDDQRHPLKVVEGGKGQASVSGRPAMDMELRLPALPRAATTIGLLKGGLRVIGPSKMLTFTFDKLAKDEKQKQEGVTVTVSELTTDQDRWTVGIVLDYPPGGPEFESFQSWLVNNRIALDKRGGQPFPANGGSDEVASPDGTHVVLHYHFVEANGRKLGKPEDWRLIYRTPGKIVAVPVAFEFKDVRLR
jgi:hypothetical protein